MLSDRVFNCRKCNCTMEMEDIKEKFGSILEGQIWEEQVWHCEQCDTSYVISLTATFNESDIDECACEEA